MRETSFVNQNKEKWEKLEGILRSSKKNPRELRDNFIQLTDDLSYSRTFYRNRSVRVYLNQLAQLLYRKVYANKQRLGARIASFWRDDLPLLAYHSRKDMLLSFLVALFGVMIGVLCSMADPQFPSSILGEGYVQMTLENIRKGDPLGVYKSDSMFQMFLSIAINNLQVAFLMFGLGTLLGIGTAILLMRNGIMLGVFMYFFYSRGLAMQFNFTVWLHGTLEILSMVIEGAAGLALGRGLLFPGTLSRMRSFQFGARRGMRLMMASVPIIILAAFIESYITRFTEIPYVIRGILIFLSLGFMVWYFVVYPWLRYRGDRSISAEEEREHPDVVLHYSVNHVQNNGNVLLKTFTDLRWMGVKFLWLVVLVAVAVWYAFLKFYPSNTIDDMQLLRLSLSQMGAGGWIFDAILTVMRAWRNIPAFFKLETGLGFFLIVSGWFWILALVMNLWLHQRIHGGKPGWRFVWRCLYSCALPILAANLLLAADNGFMTLLFVIFAPLFLLWMACCVWVGGNPVSAWLSATRYYFNSYWKVMAGWGINLVLMLMLMFFVMSPIWFLMQYFVEANFDIRDEFFSEYLRNAQAAVMILVFSIGICISMVQSVYQLFSVREINDAAHLKASISQLGGKRKMYGMETE